MKQLINDIKGITGISKRNITQKLFLSMVIGLSQHPPENVNHGKMNFNFNGNLYRQKYTKIKHVTNIGINIHYPYSDVDSYNSV